MMPIDYKRAYLWEVTALDPSAPYGAMPEDYVSSQTLRSMLGINAFWGWGYNRYTDGLQPGEGPEMYTSVASYARDYHNMNWDVRDPDDDISFADMAATGGTPAQWWLNWEREYAAWISKGMPVHASIQMVNFTDSTWDNPYSSAYKYGLSFARFFGPTYGNGQVEIVEVGNEPWKYDSTVYRTILRGMTRGLKEGDPAMTVLPCALQAYNPGAEATSNKNYIGARISATEAELIDGLNIHPYSFYKGVDGVRRAVHPEHNYSQMRGILNAIRWRDHNMPGKPIYVTEWGWDSDGATQECVHNECVSEDAAAAYVGRGLLMMQRMGVEKATYFYHSNLWGMTLFTRSGLTGGKEVNFVKKKSYYALHALRTYGLIFMIVKLVRQTAEEFAHHAGAIFFFDFSKSFGSFGHNLIRFVHDLLKIDFTHHSFGQTFKDRFFLAMEISIGPKQNARVVDQLTTIARIRNRWEYGLNVLRAFKLLFKLNEVPLSVSLKNIFNFVVYLIK